MISMLAAGLAAPAAAELTESSNGVYRVTVDDHGAYTAATSQLHPVPNVGLLYPSVTSWGSVRSYASGTEWLLADVGVPSADPGYACGAIADTAARLATPILDGRGRRTGTRIAWYVRTALDDLEIVQEINVEGTTYENSVVRVTTCITNDDAFDAEVGLRYLWDLQIGGQDGASIGLRPPGPPVEPYLAAEQDFPSPTFDFYDVSDQQRPSVTPSAYTVGGSVNQPVLALPPTPPDLMQYATWGGPANTCFDYATRAQPLGQRDSAMVYYWGATPATALRIAPGGTFCATQYLFAYPAQVPPPLCDLAVELFGGDACDADVTLDASSSRSSSCTGSLEFRFTDPSGALAEDWSTDPFATATSNGAWTVDVRCSTQPTCTDSKSAPVLIHRVPGLTASATLIAPCDQGVELAWNAAFNGATGDGLVNIYRSVVDCADAVRRPPFLADVAGTGLRDTTTVAGQTYWYVVEAEDATPGSPCAPAGGVAGGAATRLCLGPFSDTFDRTPPPRICWPLRVGHAGDASLLDWSASRPLSPGEHYHVMKTTLDPRNPFVQVNGEGDLGVAYSETDTSAWLHFFDVRLTDDCEITSEDDEPPYLDGPLPTCP